MTPADFDKVLERYVEGRCTEAEKLQVETWFNAMGANQNGDGLDVAAREQLKAKLWAGLDRQTAGSDRKRFWKMVRRYCCCRNLYAGKRGFDVPQLPRQHPIVGSERYAGSRKYIGFCAESRFGRW